MRILIILPFLLQYCAGVEGLKCYTCSMTDEETDQSCLTDPDNAGITDCDKKYCISVRVDYLDPKDTIQSLLRTCVDTPTFINQVIEDETYRNYYKACQTDLCNGGIGKDLSDATDNRNGDAITLLVPGIGTDAAHSIVVSLTLILVLQIVLFLHHI
ncbi:hypothetical protein QE152_g27492 [Popillia japonica]|uniref:Uncharacterized protein n=1 Tax=Popillia japonica TaxID=7064 RepID=A0AAW1JVH0_POPJA